MRKEVLQGCKRVSGCPDSGSVQVSGLCAGAGGQVEQVRSQT